MTERDLQHLNECEDAYGIGASIVNGHLTDFTYDDKEIDAAAKRIAADIEYIQKRHIDGIYEL